MDTNYNRIKVADLETNEPDKILSTNSLGELEFSDLNNIKTDTYNELDYTQQDKALDARQGKVLKDLIDNKVDKVSGERLINTSEINKLSGLSNVVTTIKPILSNALSTQDVAGFVSYINSLNPVLVVGSNEIVKFTTTDTGRVFQLNLRGRSFGTGQSPILVSDVVEITAFLNKDLKLSNYPSTRNDGQLPTNKVLSTDANGNLKMYNLPNFQAPFLGEVSPTFLPNSTGNLTLTGAFFTPSMTVSIAGQTVNYITFVNDNLIKVNITTGSAEGNFAITLNNGMSATFQKVLIIVLGTVFIPSDSDWVNRNQPIDILNGMPVVKTWNSLGSAVWNKQFDTTKNISIRFNFSKSPIGSVPTDGTTKVFTLFDSVTLTELFSVKCRTGRYGHEPFVRVNGTDTGSSYYYDGAYGIYDDTVNDVGEFRYVAGIWYFYLNNSLRFTYTQHKNYVNPIQLKISTTQHDTKNIKYIELAI